MALTANEKRQAWRYLLEKDPTVGQVFDKNQLDAAANATDAWIEANQASFNAALPASPGFRSASLAQKTLLFTAISQARAGLL
jgi:hypothetical protein